MGVVHERCPRQLDTIAARFKNNLGRCKVSKFLAVVALLSGIVGLSTQASAAGWLICNRTPEELQVAIAYHDGANGWLTEGWWSLKACGGCTRVMDQSKTDGANVFYRAVTPRGDERIGGKTHFCVSSHANGAPPWTGRSPKVCGKGYVSGGFSQHTVDTEKDFRSNITGKVAGKVCLD
jgi:uncharacterized membrane protein